MTGAGTECLPAHRQLVGRMGSTVMSSQLLYLKLNLSESSWKGAWKVPGRARIHISPVLITSGAVLILGVIMKILGDPPEFDLARYECRDVASEGRRDETFPCPTILAEM